MTIQKTSNRFSRRYDLEALQRVRLGALAVEGDMYLYHPGDSELPNFLSDGDMEAANVDAWTPDGVSGCSKATSPATLIHRGTRSLKVRRYIAA